MTGITCANEGRYKGELLHKPIQARPCAQKRLHETWIVLHLMMLAITSSVPYCAFQVINEIPSNVNRSNQQTGVVECKRYSEVTGAELNIEHEEKS